MDMLRQKEGSKTAPVTNILMKLLRKVNVSSDGHYSGVYAEAVQSHIQNPLLLKFNQATLVSGIAKRGPKRDRNKEKLEEQYGSKMRDRMEQNLRRSLKKANSSKADSSKANSSNGIGSSGKKNCKDLEDACIEKEIGGVGCLGVGDNDGPGSGCRDLDDPEDDCDEVEVFRVERGGIVADSNCAFQVDGDVVCLGVNQSKEARNMRNAPGVVWTNVAIKKEEDDLCNEKSNDDSSKQEEKSRWAESCGKEKIAGERIVERNEAVIDSCASCAREGKDGQDQPAVDSEESMVSVPSFRSSSQSSSEPTEDGKVAGGGCGVGIPKQPSDPGEFTNEWAGSTASGRSLEDPAEGVGGTREGVHSQLMDDIGGDTAAAEGKVLVKDGSGVAVQAGVNGSSEDGEVVDAKILANNDSGVDAVVEEVCCEVGLNVEGEEKKEGATLGEASGELSGIASSQDDSAVGSTFEPPLTQRSRESNEGESDESSYPLTLKAKENQFQLYSSDQPSS